MYYRQNLREGRI